MRPFIALIGILSASGAVIAPNSKLERAVERWLSPIEGSWNDIEFIDRHRCEALPKLIAALRVVPNGEFGEWSDRRDTLATNRTSNALRALRILTAHDEYGPISRRDFKKLPRRTPLPGGGSVMQPTDLLTGKLGQSRFFAYWLSHGETYYAPAATQRAIIAKWRRFIRTFDCRAPLPKWRTDATFFNG